jgi:pimeloyl-ACP methyl ester carboxylesterase
MRATTVDHEQTRTLTVNGVRLHYEERGSGVPILCIHGAGSSALVWRPAAAQLARFGRVICYDRRGHARSERPAPFLRTLVAEHADDAAAMLVALGATPAVVIGRSYGGQVGLDLALRHPRHVRALVLLEGVPESLDAEGDTWVRDLRARTLAAGEREPEAAVETLFKGVLGDAGWESLPDHARRTFLDNGPAVLADLRGEDFLELDAGALARIDKPTLLVAATDSHPWFRRVSELAAAAMPDARSALVGGGHMIDPADPVVIDFLEEVVA